jgi:molecular chaperone GrpE
MAEEKEEQKQTSDAENADTSEKVSLPQQEETESLKQENQDLLDQLKRAVADYRNLQARTEKEKSAFIVYAQADTIKKFLPIMDNLEKAAVVMKDKGIDLILEQFKKTLSDFGVMEMDALGKEFDPNFHECIDITEGAENKVVEVLDNGYLMDEKVLRPAKVKVGKRGQEKNPEKTS